MVGAVLDDAALARVEGASGARVVVSGDRSLVDVLGAPAEAAAARAALGALFVPVATVHVGAEGLASAFESPAALCRWLAGGGRGAAGSSPLAKVAASTGAGVHCNERTGELVVMGPPAAAAAAVAALQALLARGAAVDARAEWGAHIGTGAFGTPEALCAWLAGPDNSVVRGVERDSGAAVYASCGGAPVVVVLGRDAAGTAAGTSLLGARLAPSAIINCAATWAEPLLGAPAARMVAGLAREAGAAAAVSGDGARLYLWCGEGDLPRVRAAANQLAPVSAMGVSDTWGHLISPSGPYDSPAAIVVRLRHRIRDHITRETGARIRFSKDNELVFVSGTEGAVARARAELHRHVVPIAQVAVADVWGHLIGEGKMYETAENFRQRVVGTGGSLALEIHRKTGAEFLFSHDHTRTYFIGTSVGAAAARAEIDKLATPLMVVEVDDTWGHLIDKGVYESCTALCSLIIGHGGANATAIRAATGASVFASRDSARVFFTGTPSTVRAARVAVEKAVVPTATFGIQKEWGKLITAGVYESEAEVCRRIVGNRGETSSALAQKTGARVAVSSASDAVFVYGDAAQVADVRAKLDRLLQPTATVVVEEAWGHLIAAGMYASREDLIRYLVGRAGETIRGVAQRTHAGVFVGRSSKEVHFTGSSRRVAAARAEVEQLVAPALTLDVSATWGQLIANGSYPSAVAVCGQIVGRKGEHCDAVQRTTGAHIVVAKDARTVFICGPPSAASMARAEIDKLLRQPA